MTNYALISVWNKDGLVEFARELVTKYNFKIVSTTSTAKYLCENNIECIKVEDITEFQEILNGKVKTLHPKIHASLLADPKQIEDINQLDKLNIKPFQMAVVNLYPFEEVSKQTDDVDELVKNIDIGGVAILRAASKNFKNVTCVCDKNDYNKVLEDLKNNDGQNSYELNEKLALKAFYNTAKYDSIINTKLANVFDDNEYLNLNIKKLKELRYGENPHQKADLYELPNFESEIVDYEVLNGKELSYNNYLDMTYALNIASEFYDVPCCTIVKHNIPSGVALGTNSLEAYKKALDCDPISAFGGVVAFTKNVNINVAKHLKELFLEVIIAPNFDDDALELLQTKKNLRLIKLNTKFELYKRIISKEIKITPFGTLVQTYDVKELDKDTFKVVTKIKPDKDVIEDLIFAWKIAKHVKSNAIVIAKDFKTLGIAGGNTSRVESCEISLNKACDGSKDAVLASDGFFPAIDNIQYAAQGRIKAIIQPGGSIKDKDVIETADKYNIAMVTTGIRHFKH